MGFPYDLALKGKEFEAEVITYTNGDVYFADSFVLFGGTGSNPWSPHG